MAIIKGYGYRNAPTNEGFVSYFQDLPEEVFARVTTGTPPNAFAKEVPVTFPLGSNHLEV